MGRASSMRCATSWASPPSAAGSSSWRARRDELARLDELERRGAGERRAGDAGRPPRASREIEPHARGVARCTRRTRASSTSRASPQALREDDRGERRGRGDGLRGATAVAPGRVEHELGETRAGRHLLRRACSPTGSRRAAARRPTPRIVPFRGAYSGCGARSSCARDLPRARSGLPFLGVHLTRRIQGDVVAGPTALPVGARDAYRLGRVRRATCATRCAGRAPGAWPGAGAAPR